MSKEPKRTTLREMLELLRVDNTLYIYNECNEGLVTLAQVDENVLPLDKALNDSLLDRKVLNCGVYSGAVQISLEGVDDAV